MSEINEPWAGAGYKTIGQLGQQLAEKDSEIERLKKQLEAQGSVIRRILKHIENGTLVRDISKDAGAGWVLPMMRLVVDLKDATEAVKVLGGERE